MSEQNLGDEFRAQIAELLDTIGKRIPEVIASTDDRIAFQPDAANLLADFHQPLPDKGNGAAATIERLIELNETAGGSTAGPRCFHFLIGGNTTAAHAADLLATAYDTITYPWVLSPAGVEIERQSLD
jgi:hypothetical protein